MRSRLGVSLNPVGSNGPLIWNELTRNTRSWPPPGTNICLRSSDSAWFCAEGNAYSCAAPPWLRSGFLEAVVDRIQRAVVDLIEALHVLFAADHDLVDELAVERDDERVLELHVVAPEAADHVGDVHFVFAVGREVVLCQDAATGAERQTGNVRCCVVAVVLYVLLPARASGRPTACTATVRAAITYCSMNDGDTCSVLAMLSKPSSVSSCGSSSTAST